MMFANQEIVDYMNQHLMHYMNPMALLPNLQQQHLLTEEDVGKQYSQQIWVYVLHVCTGVHRGRRCTIEKC